MMNFISSDSLFFQPFFFSLYTFFPVNMKTALAITRTLSRRYYPLHPEEQEALASIMECRRVDSLIFFVFLMGIGVIGNFAVSKNGKVN